MKLAFAYLKFTPSTFWAMSLREWQAAVIGYREKHAPPIRDEDTISRDRLNELMEQYPDV